MSHANQLSRALARAEALPPALRRRLVTFLFNRRVRFAGTAGIDFEVLSAERAVLHLKNRKRVQNHIGGIHAAGMALLAETATGAVFGMNLPDSALPLLKRMDVEYLKRVQGDLRAEASLSVEQRARLVDEPKGHLVVPVRVTDASGAEPIRCAMSWAWVPKRP